MNRHKLEIVIDVCTRYGCINKVIETTSRDISSDTLFELWLDNAYAMIKTEALNEFRVKKERNFRRIEE